MRQVPTLTLEQFKDSISVPNQTTIIDHDKIKFDLTDKMLVKLGKKEVPVTDEGTQAFASYLDIPSKFFQRLNEELQEHLLTVLLAQYDNSSACAVMLDDNGVRMVRDPALKFIDPRHLVERVSNVIDPKAIVVESFLTSDEFRFDTMVPEGFKKGIGGDKKVGDITRGGVRVGHDIKHNLAPFVQPWMFRLACTNGVETFWSGLKVEARHNSVDAVLEEFEAMAEEAFSRVEDDIKAYYDLRTVKVDEPERTLLRIATEEKLPDRSTMALAKRVPAYLEEDDEATMFMLANLITNAANDPAIRYKNGVRRRLEQIGGNIVRDHAERCVTCQSKLN